MNKNLIFGAGLFIIGFLITIIYPIVTNEESGIKVGLILMGIGALIIILFLIIERIKDNKQFKKEFKKEDLRP
jgi:hypothetical protein